ERSRFGGSENHACGTIALDRIENLVQISEQLRRAGIDRLARNVEPDRHDLLFIRDGANGAFHNATSAPRAWRRLGRRRRTGPLYPDRRCDASSPVEAS